MSALTFSMARTKQYVRRYAHVEYENGFLIFDRLDDEKEVWLLETMVPQDGPTEALGAPVVDSQRRIASFSLERHSDTYPHGHFRPWALLSLPELTRVYCYVHPTFAVIGARTAYLFDIPTGTRQTIKLVQDFVSYVSISEDYIFVCAVIYVRVYSRRSETLALEIPQSAVTGCRTLSIDPDRLQPNEKHQVLKKRDTSEITAGVVSNLPNPQQVLAAHVTPDGRHLAILYFTARLLLIQDWKQCLNDERLLRECSLEIVMYGARNVDLAVADGRVALAAVRPFTSYKRRSKSDDAGCFLE
jgi:hypothetical protein